MGQVNSLYFDTPDLDQHQRSDSGEFNKDKIRIRWYGEEYDPHRADERRPRPTGRSAVWLERKSRGGFASTKQRTCLDVPALQAGPCALRQGHRVRPLCSATPSPASASSPTRPSCRSSPSRTGATASWSPRPASASPSIRTFARRWSCPGSGEVSGPWSCPARSSRSKAPGSRCPGRCVTSPRSARRGPATPSTPRASRRTIRPSGSVSRFWPNGMMEAAPGRPVPG